jgi:pseudouridine synthase
VALALTHPSYQVKKVYDALVQGIPSPSLLEKLRNGVLLEDGPTLPAEVDIIKIKAGNAILRIGIREGRKRQVRRMCEAVGHRVIALKRMAMGPLQLGSLPPGKYRQLTATEISALRRISRAR